MVELRIGDFVFIKEIIIDRKVQEYLQKGNNKLAIKWDSYRNFKFEIIGVDKDNLVILKDANGNQVHISKKALEI